MTDTTQPHPEPSQEASSLPRYTIDCSSNEYGNHWNIEGDSEGSLCLYADAQSQLSALRTRLQEQALQYLSDNGQWIEETGRLRTERDEALAKLHALQALTSPGQQNGERYRWLVEGKEPPGIGSAGTDGGAVGVES